MWMHPGKKLLFMGCELGQPGEWNADAEIDWACLDHEPHRGVQRLVRDLNASYADAPALHAGDGVAEAFAWVVGDDRANSVYAFVRSNPFGDGVALAVFNMTPVVRHGYRVGVPRGGAWRERLNSDAAIYGGSNVGNGGTLRSEAIPMHGHPQSIALTLPPLGGLVLEPAR